MAKKTGIFVILAFLVPSFCSALTLKQAMDKAAEYFTKQAVKIEQGQALHVLEVINFASFERDIEGKRIETELYFALERQFADFKLFLGKGENKKNEIYLNGTYEQKGDKTVVRLRIFQNKKQILSQYAVTYETKVRRKTLVAVLDLEAPTLNVTQRKAFSDIYRTALSKGKDFDIASSADIDKMNPDEIQQATGCSRDTCATIIGEQLGVDRVISSSFMKIDEDYYVVSSKMMDIQDGSILVSETVEHTGKLRTLRVALDKLAAKLIGRPEKVQAKPSPKPKKVTPPPAKVAVKKEPPPPAKEKIEAAEEPPPVEEPDEPEVGSSDKIWHIIAISGTVLSAYLATTQAASYNDLASENEGLESDIAATSTTAEYESLKGDYESNQDAMTGHKSNVTLFNTLTVVFLAWEAYLWYFGSDSGDTAALIPGNSSTDLAFKPELGYQTGQLYSKLSVSWKW